MFACGGAAPKDIQPGKKPVLIPCVTPKAGTCATNDDCPPAFLDYRVKPKDSLASISRKYGMNQKIILGVNEIKDFALIQPGTNLVIPLIYECAHFEDRSVCAKPNGMCASGDKCQTDEVCDMRFTHTDHLHLYKHGICVCPSE